MLHPRVHLGFCQDVAIRCTDNDAVPVARHRNGGSEVVGLSHTVNIPSQLRPAGGVRGRAVFEHAHVSLTGVMIPRADDDAAPVGRRGDGGSEVIIRSHAVDVPAEDTRQRHLEFSRVCEHVKVRD